ncbi:MAG: FAD-binding protein [bacterium]|nr:FAD-binding protein [bacterium]
MTIAQKVSLQERCWFRTGGAAEFFCAPQDEAELCEALGFARAQGLAVTVLGEGANVLISDDGIAGLVIRPALRYCRIEPGAQGEVFLTAGAGAALEEVIEYALRSHALGLEEFSGVPGTVGGSVFINAHYFEFLLSQFVHAGRVMSCADGTVARVGADWFRFGYDVSRLHERTHILVDATFRLRMGTPEEVAYARGRRAEILRHRARRYPASHTCGSFFQNFAPEEVALVLEGRPITAVAYYLDRLGIKGVLAVGDAVVSVRHANMIVNRGKATSTQIATLARRMQEMLRDTFGLVPRPECQLLGFQSWPLLTK